MHLLGVLNTLRGCFDEHGIMTAAGNELRRKYFYGVNARFSDESESNKRTFHQAMTFRLPDGTPLFCPYHGKIAHRVFRIHYSEPIVHNKPLYIAYIGTKITKA
jgi:hypothetical protein